MSILHSLVSLYKFVFIIREVPQITCSVSYYFFHYYHSDTLEFFLCGVGVKFLHYPFTVQVNFTSTTLFFI